MYRTRLVVALVLGFVLARIVRLFRSAAHPVPLGSLRAPVSLTLDTRGIPTIAGTCRTDVMCALGFITARDRLFQMDLLRRSTAGRLAEILGPSLVAFDSDQRIKGFNRTARAVVGLLPEEQREALGAYAEGVNAYIRGARFPGLEFLLLRYRPEPWSVEDSVLVALYMAQALTADEQARERSATVMERTLPREVFAFLTSDADEFTTVLTGGAAPRRPLPPIPAAQLAQLARLSAGSPADVSQAAGLIQGSNAWVVAASRSATGRAILANDLHLPLSVPNIWYRARLQYGDCDLSGVTIPGCPMVVVGSNRHVAWGLTNACADSSDLVLLELDPANPAFYRTPGGWRQFDQITEDIQVRGQPPVQKQIRTTCWGPVLEEPLLGQPVALKWTALEPDCLDFGLLDMDAAGTVAEAAGIARRYKGPPMNVLLCDDQGHIGWTCCGRLPQRVGHNGFTSRSWADGACGWSGLIPPDELPLVIDPPAGYLVSANHRSVGPEYPHVLGHNYPTAYRAHRISQRLEQPGLDEPAMLDIQLDIRSEFLEFYRDLALELLDAAPGQDHELLEARRLIADWDGTYGLDSPAVGLLKRFRELLLDQVLGAYLTPCRQADPTFRYVWYNPEATLRTLLRARLPDTLPEPARYADWPALLRDLLQQSIVSLKQQAGGPSLRAATWRRLNTVTVAHPFAAAAGPLGALLNMPPTALPGGEFCVLVAGLLGGTLYGPTLRMVVAPGDEQRAILHMPGGQSGHPLSRRYRDQHAAWADGAPLPFLPGSSRSRVVFSPCCKRPHA